MLFILCPVLFSYFTSTRAVKTKFFTKIERNRLKQTLVPGLVVFIFIFIVYVGLRSFLDRELIVSALLNVGVTQSNYPYIFLYIIFINAALEELFFRGFVFLNLHRMGLTKSAHLYSALLFAFYHISVLRSGATPVI
jgi:membrane protease YdiL (CAAX protease family)